MLHTRTSLLAFLAAVVVAGLLPGCSAEHVKQAVCHNTTTSLIPGVHGSVVLSEEELTIDLFGFGSFADVVLSVGSYSWTLSADVSGRLASTKFKVDEAPDFPALNGLASVLGSQLRVDGKVYCGFGRMDQAALLMGSKEFPFEGGLVNASFAILSPCDLRQSWPSVPSVNLVKVGDAGLERKSKVRVDFVGLGGNTFSAFAIRKLGDLRDVSDVCSSKPTSGELKLQGSAASGKEYDREQLPLDGEDSVVGRVLVLKDGNGVPVAYGLLEVENNAVVAKPPLRCNDDPFCEMDAWIVAAWVACVVLSIAGCGGLYIMVRRYWGTNTDEDAEGDGVELNNQL